MVLLAALILGLLAGYGLALGLKRPYVPPELRFFWLLPVAFAPQLVTTYLPVGRAMPAKSLAAVVLPLTLILFLAFVWLNRGVPGMPLVMAGLVLNLLVISANGGWMPISPETASQLPGGSPVEDAITGIRVGDKDILLAPQETRLEPLADRFLLPEGLGYRAAFSLGDAFVAAGAFWILASPPILMRTKRSTYADN